MIKADQVVDVKGQMCPRPLLMAKQALKTMQSGQILQVIADDVTTKLTFHSYLERSGDELLDEHQDGPVIHYYIKKK
jgi:TusA-related sulfurtransferase